MLDRSYFMQHPMAIPLSIHDNVEARRAWSRVELEQQLAMACRAQLQNGDRLPYGAAERLMMILQAYKGSAAAMAMPSMKYTQAGSSCVGDIGLTLSSSQSPNHMLGGNIEAAAAAGLLDSGRALSLLSSQALPTSTTSSHQAALEKFIDHNTVSIQHHDNYPPITLQSGFSLADYSLNHQYKLLSALPSSPRSLGLSVGMSVAGVAEKEQQQRLSQKVLQNHAVENLGSNPVLAQLLQRPEFRNLGGSSPPDVKDSMELPSSDSEQNHHQQRFATSPLQASTASLSQHLQSLRGYELSSLFSAPPNTA